MIEREHSWREIGRAIGTSAERARQIGLTALEKMRRALEGPPPRRPERQEPRTLK